MTDDARTRLKSMKQYVTQFNVSRKKKEDIGNPALAHAKQRIDAIVTQMGSTHSEVKPLVMELLRQPNANLGIHQLRWIQYNNIWCRTHGPPYLDDQKARNSASSDHAAMTKYRSEHGMDTGRCDNLDHETCDKDYFRKQEFSDHKATLISANLNSGGVKNVLAEKLKQPQDSKWLYWNTMNWHTDGEPKSANWNNDLLMMLSELRSHTRTINGAGWMYTGPQDKELKKRAS